MLISKKRLLIKITNFEKRIADLEGQVQSQREIIIQHIKSDDVINNEMRDLIKQGLDAHASLCK